MVYKIFLAAVLCVGIFSCEAQKTDKNTDNNTYKINKSETEWKELLTPAEYEVLRGKGTERAFSGIYNNHHEKGYYLCAACKNQVFHSSTKFDSGTGWPSFYKPVSEESIKIVTDKSLGMLRDEVVCADCGGHLGHVFEDGPKPTGLRYCLNSVALDFEEE